MDYQPDPSIADPADEVPPDWMDEILGEYQRNVIFDGTKLIAGEG